MAYKGPYQVAKDLVEVGIKKAHLSFLDTVVLSILAGIYLAIAGAAMIMVTFDTGALGESLIRFVAGSVFSLGLMLVILGGTELFTGNTLLSVCCFTGTLRVKMMLRNWSIVYLGNFVGSLIIAFLVFYSGVWLISDRAPGIFAVEIAVAKTQHSFMDVLLRGIGANWLVTVAIWLALSGTSTVDKVLGIYFPIATFVILGFEHSIANMFFLPMGLLVKQVLTVPGAADLTISTAIFNNLIPVTIGNIIGGVVFVGFPYWYVYVRKHNDLPEDKGKGGKAA